MAAIDSGMRGQKRLAPLFAGLFLSRAHRIHELLKFGRLVVGDLHGVAMLDAAMHRECEVETGAACPGASVVDVTGKALLVAIEIDGRDPLARLHQGNGDVQGYGGFARPPFSLPSTTT